MQRSRENIIDPKTIQDVKSFEWIAKKLASGFMHGKHEASRLGAGMEFQQFRPYVSGDDIRGIDWKMYAKTDKLYIKETSIQTENKYRFIIDNSPSMKYTEDGWSKLFYAKLLCAAMMSVLSNQGDHFSWVSGSQSMPIGSGKRHWQHCIETLYPLNFEKGNFQSNLIPQTSITNILISDFYTPLSDIKESLKLLKHPKSELILFHLMGSKERTLEFGANTTFVDLETNERLDVNADKKKKAYQEKLSRHISQLRNTCFEMGAVFEEVLTTESITISLQRFFHHYQYAAI